MKMKTLKIVTTFAALNLILFMSNNYIAIANTKSTGDVVKTSVNKQIVVNENTLLKINATAETEFSYLRFDVNKFTGEATVAELPARSIDYLRFDVNNFINEEGNEITELPVERDFNYLRFDVRNFSAETNAEINELPSI
jgi:hypothetical protein